MAEGCEVKRIQLNSAQSAFDTAKHARDKSRQDYLACQGPQAQGAAAVEDAQGDATRIMKEGEDLMYMNEFLLRQLGKEASSEVTMSALGDMARTESAKLNGEIDRLKSEIRTERRRFLDANPSVSPAVAGMYFTQVPDNQALIAFIVCYAAFLLFVGIAVIMGLLPIRFLQDMTSSERVKNVAIFWVAALSIAYTGFFMFT